MGRIKTKLTKRLTNELLEKHHDKFTDNFDAKQEKVTALTTTSSKKMRNVIAGYVTRLIKKEKAEQ